MQIQSVIPQGLGAVMISSLLALAAHVQAQQPNPKPMGLPVKATPVRIGTVTHDVTAVGSLLANESVVIRPEVAGRVVAIHFNEGQVVAHRAAKRLRG